MMKRAKEKQKGASSSESQKIPEEFLPHYSLAMEEWATKWIDEKIPALGGKTPREAAGTPEGKKKVEELLKDFENVEERNKKEGEPYIDIQVLRQRLNI